MKSKPPAIFWVKCYLIPLHTKDNFMTLPEQSRRIHSICCIDKVDVWSESRARRTTSATTYKFNEYASHIFSQRFSLFSGIVCVQRWLFIIIQGQSWLKVIKPFPSITLAFQPVTSPSIKGGHQRMYAWLSLCVWNGGNRQCPSSYVFS